LPAEVVKNTQSKNQDCDCKNEDETDQGVDHGSEAINPDQLCSTT
jgi:hypothetical protein